MNIKKNTKSIIMTASIIAGGYLHANAQDTKQQSSPGDLVNAMHSAFGDNHSRAVHAKGIIFEGNFVPNKDAAVITEAAHLQNESSKVLLRFSDFTGIPTIPDNNPAANPRCLGIKFIMPIIQRLILFATALMVFPLLPLMNFVNFYWPLAPAARM